MKPLNRWHLCALLLASAAACSGSKDDDPTTGGTDEAIEITGYLDGSKVSWSTLDDLVIAAGTEEAASAGSTITLTNLDRDVAPAERTVADDGSFAVETTGSLGDHLLLEVGDAADEHDLQYEVEDLPPFPETESVDAAAATDRPHHASVEVVLAEPADGWIVASNPHRHVAIELSAGDGLNVHHGIIAGTPGEWLVLHWMTGTDESTGAIEVQISHSD